MPSDLEALQGAWEQVAFEQDSVLDPPDAYTAPGVITTFRRDRFMVHSPDGALLLEGRFELDDVSKTVDWIDSMGPDAGKRLPAIYKLEGDNFVFIAADAGAERPREFRTRAGQTMRSFVRRATS